MDIQTKIFSWSPFGIIDKNDITTFGRDLTAYTVYAQGISLHLRGHVSFAYEVDHVTAMAYDSFGYNSSKKKRPYTIL